MEVKRCSGYKGHWECENDYPDHQVPVEEFNSGTTRHNGVQPRCRRCSDYHWSKRPKNPITGEVKRHWKERAAKSCGGIQGTPEWQSYLDRAEEQWGKEVTYWKINDKVVDITPRFKSEYGPSKPMTKRETLHVEGEVVPQGWVYVIRNTETPWLFKIGKTYPDGIQSRLSEARRWGCFKLEEKYWFEDALKAEKEVHAMLREHNMRNLGFEDCGTELFKCWNIGIITDAINKVQSGNDRPSIAVGK